MSKYKVIVYPADTGGCAEARLIDPIKYITKNHSDTFSVDINYQINRTDYLDMEDDNPMGKILGKKADLLIFQRSTNKGILDFMKDAQANGVKVIYETDDYFDKIQLTSTAYASYIKDPNTLKNIHALMKQADAITVSTENLKKAYNATYVLPNSMDFDDFKDTKKVDNKDKIIIGWMGSSTHFEDLKQIASAIVQVCNKYPNVYFALGGWDLKKAVKVDENPVGVFPIEKEYEGKTYTLLPNVSKLKPLFGKYLEIIEKEGKQHCKLLKLEVDNDVLRKEFPKINLDEFILIRKRSVLKKYQYFKLEERYLLENLPEDKIIDLPWVTKVNELGKVFKTFDIGLAPLHDNSFNDAKSNIKFLQYSSLGIPTIASNLPPYSEIESGVNGITIKAKGAQHDKWVKALERLIADADLREELGKNAYNYVKEKYDMNTNCDLWVNAWVNTIVSDKEGK